MSSSKTCPACIASRKSVVDAFFAGYRVGYTETVRAGLEREVPEAAAAFGVASFCLPHEKMLTETYAGVLSDLMEKGRKDHG